MTLIKMTAQLSSEEASQVLAQAKCSNNPNYIHLERNGKESTVLFAKEDCEAFMEQVTSSTKNYNFTFWTELKSSLEQLRNEYKNTRAAGYFLSQILSGDNYLAEDFTENDIDSLEGILSTINFLDSRTDLSMDSLNYLAATVLEAKDLGILGGLGRKLFNMVNTRMKIENGQPSELGEFYYKKGRGPKAQVAKRFYNANDLATQLKSFIVLNDLKKKVASNPIFKLKNFEGLENKIKLIEERLNSGALKIIYEPGSVEQNQGGFYNDSLSTIAVGDDFLKNSKQFIRGVGTPADILIHEFYHAMSDISRSSSNISLEDEEINAHLLQISYSFCNSGEAALSNYYKTGAVLKEEYNECISSFKDLTGIDIDKVIDLNGQVNFYGRLVDKFRECIKKLSSGEKPENIILDLRYPAFAYTVTRALVEFIDDYGPGNVYAQYRNGGIVELPIITKNTSGKYEIKTTQIELKTNNGRLQLKNIMENNLTTMKELLASMSVTKDPLTLKQMRNEFSSLLAYFEATMNVYLVVAKVMNEQSDKYLNNKPGATEADIHSNRLIPDPQTYFEKILFPFFVDAFRSKIGRSTPISIEKH